jgi:hypothetical protein
MLNLKSFYSYCSLNTPFSFLSEISFFVRGKKEDLTMDIIKEDAEVVADALLQKEKLIRNKIGYSALLIIFIINYFILFAQPKKKLSFRFRNSYWRLFRRWFCKFA